jgi:phenylalanyl-tRNA synthetase alpha chain
MPETAGLNQFVTDLENLAADATRSFNQATSVEELEALRVEYLGAKNGRFKTAQKGLGGIESSDKPAAGKKLNEAKQQIQTAFEIASQRLGKNKPSTSSDIVFDPTLPGSPVKMGALHPITQTIQELKDIMGRLGFSTADGPEIEDQWHNFEALNIPLEHPARDPLDNFFIATAGKHAQSKMLLRSQTSTVQIRTMESTPPPVRIISLGRVYRPDTADPTHYPQFHQMEGLMIDQHVTMADLKTVLRLFATNYLGSDVNIRFRPSFFPFTEPSVEADYYWDGKWVEFGGAGMVDPNVLNMVGYNPQEVTGFAFGLGVERLCMRRHQIKDIRDLYTNEIRFLSQF